nr:DMT family transporter [uncultured Oscillibacter sp.]
MYDWEQKPTNASGTQSHSGIQPSLRPVLAVSLGQIIWGFSTLFTKLALQFSEPDVLLSIRFLLSAFLMTLLILFKKARVSFRGKKLKPLFLLAGSEVLYFYFESYGIFYTNAIFAGVVLSVVPVVAIFLAMFFLKEFPTRRQAFFCVLPVAGVIIMTAAGSSLGIIHPIGVVFLICSCISSAAYKTANRKSSEEFTPFERTYAVLVVSAAVFTISAIKTVSGDFRMYLVPLSQPTFLFSIFMLSVFCSVGSNMLVNYAAGRMPVVQLSSFGSLSTLCSMFAGMVFLNEPMTVSLLLGSVLILTGIRYVTK